MKPSKDRNLNVLDGMILVAATAVGIGLVPRDLGDKLSHAITDQDVNLILHWLTVGIVPTWFAWTVAVLAIRLRRPRARLSRLAGQPGFVAGIAAVAVGSVVLSFALISEALLGWIGGSILRPITFVRLPDHLAPAVAGAWLTLVVGRRWRPDSGLIDRLGRMLGAGWIALLLTLMAIAAFF